jgi:hypothetical protein
MWALSTGRSNSRKFYWLALQWSPFKPPWRTTSGVSFCFPLGYRWSDSVLSDSPHNMQLYSNLFQLYFMIHSFHSAFNHMNKNSDPISTFKMFQVANCSRKIFELSPMNFNVVESNKGSLDQHSVSIHIYHWANVIDIWLAGLYAQSASSYPSSLDILWWKCSQNMSKSSHLTTKNLYNEYHEAHDAMNKIISFWEAIRNLLEGAHLMEHWIHTLVDTRQVFLLSSISTIGPIVMNPLKSRLHIVQEEVMPTAG